MILSSSLNFNIPRPPIMVDGLGNAYETVGSALSEAFTPPPPMDYTLWAKTNVQFGKDTEFEGSYDPDLFPFFKEVLQCLQPDHPAREVVLQKSAQIGGTIIAQVFLGACLDLDPAGIAYFCPSLDNGKRWVRTKWNPFVKLCLPLKEAFSSDRSRDTANALFFKERKDGLGFLMISGANSAASLSMFSVSRQIQDDLAKWENNEAGDSETQADSRSNAFPYAKIFKLSTPLIKGNCRISKAYDHSDQRVYKVSCPHCGHKQELTWENFKQSLHEDMEYADAHFTCTGENCGAAIEHHHKSEIVKSGFWEAKNPKSKVPGFFIWTAYSPLIDWWRIAERYFRVQGDPDAEKAFYNDWLGLPYEQKGEAPPWQVIADRANLLTGYLRGTVPPGAVLITCGCDVQGDRIEWHVKGFGPNLQRFTIDAGIIEGHISESAAQKGLEVLLNKRFKNSAGRYVGIDMLAIDANAYTEDVLDWAKRHPDSKVIAVRGIKGEFAPPLAPVKNERKKGIKKKRRQKKFFNVGVSPLKASLFKHLEKDDPTERGYCGYPREMDDEFFIQLCSERRVLVTHKKNHYAYYEWQKLAGVRNEILDTEMYAEAAARRLGWVEMTDDRWAEIIAERESEPDDTQLDMLDASLVKPRNAKPVAPVDTDDPDDDEDEDDPPPPPKKNKPKKSLAKQLA